MKYVCNICGYVYDEELGDIENDIEAGTKWEELPDPCRRRFCLWH